MEILLEILLDTTIDTPGYYERYSWILPYSGSPAGYCHNIVFHQSVTESDLRRSNVVSSPVVSGTVVFVVI